jgi:hypothetical protein
MSSKPPIGFRHWKENRASQDTGQRWEDGRERRGAMMMKMTMELYYRKREKKKVRGTKTWWRKMRKWRYVRKTEKEVEDEVKFTSVLRHFHDFNSMYCYKLPPKRTVLRPDHLIWKSYTTETRGQLLTHKIHILGARMQIFNRRPIIQTFFMILLSPSRHFPG